jgi:large subunit ribosomal protein L3
MKFLLGEKQKMSQVFQDDGSVVPVTVIKTYPSTVVFVRDLERDGYRAIQLGGGERKEKNISKPVKGHTKKYGVFRVLREFKINEKDSFAEGDVFDVTQFSPGDKLTISSVSKGKGFQGVVKRHNFAGGPRSHGQKHSEREPGSIGATGPQRVFKGTKMAGRMGGNRTTVKNVKVVQVLPEEGKLLVKGAVSGRPGTVVEIKNRK